MGNYWGNYMEILDYVVIGAGPAGLSAAIYFCRSSLKGIVLEASTPGGRLIDIKQIDNYPGVPHGSGVDLALAMLNEAMGLGAEIVYKKAISVDMEGEFFKVSLEDSYLLCRYVVLATGTSAQGKGIENEKEYLGRGISHCATCDGAFYRGKSAIVVGNGEKAVSEALYLSGLAEHLDFLCPDRDLKGDSSSVAALRGKDNVYFHFSAKPLRFVPNSGKDGIDRIEFEEGGEEKSLRADGYFPYGGQTGPLALLSSLNPRTKGNFLEVDPYTCETSIKGIYACGDCRYSLLKQVVTSASDGAEAASAVIREAMRAKR